MIIISSGYAQFLATGIFPSHIVELESALEWTQIAKC